jgi:hypothetical protein
VAGQILCAIPVEFGGQNKQMPTVEYFSGTEEIIKSSLSLHHHDSAAALNCQKNNYCH